MSDVEEMSDEDPVPMSDVEAVPMPDFGAVSPEFLNRNANELDEPINSGP